MSTTSALAWPFELPGNFLVIPHVERSAYVAPYFHERCEALALNLPNVLGKWSYVPRERDPYDMPAGNLVRADGLSLWIAPSAHTMRVEVHASQVKVAEAGNPNSRHMLLKDFLSYGAERNSFKAEAYLAIERFMNQPISVIAREVVRKVIAPASPVYAVALQHIATMQSHASNTENAAQSIATAYNGELRSGKTGHHTSTPTVFLRDLSPLSAIEVQGPNSFCISRHSFNVSRYVLDAMIKAIREERTQAKAA